MIRGHKAIAVDENKLRDNIFFQIYSQGCQLDPEQGYIKDPAEAVHKLYTEYINNKQIQNALCTIEEEKNKEK